MSRLFKSVFIIIIIGFSILFSSTSFHLFGSDLRDNSSFDAVYFGSNYCSACIEIKESGIIDSLKNDGYDVQEYYLEDDQAYISLLRDYQFTYDVPLEDNQVPVLFVGTTYFIGKTSITEHIDDGTIQNLMDTETLLPVQKAVPSDFSLIYFILLGIVDGINPCAIAMLLMFISLLSFTSKKKVLLKVSLTFISAIFISYFLFGTFLYGVLSEFRYGSFLVKSVPWIIIGISAVLFLLNMYDFVVTTKARYDKVKNQLPKGIQKLNRRLLTSFTNKMNEGSPALYIITFFIGVIISFTEFLCTGQAYLTAILHLIHYTDYLGKGVILLLFYNLIFVLPLVLITLIAVKTQSITPVAAFMRERLNLIKLFTALVFLAILLYYIFFMI